MKKIDPKIHRMWLGHQIAKIGTILHGVMTGDEREVTKVELLQLQQDWEDCLKQYEGPK